MEKALSQVHSRMQLVVSAMVAPLSLIISLFDIGSFFLLNLFVGAVFLKFKESADEENQDQRGVHQDHQGGDTRACAAHRRPICPPGASWGSRRLLGPGRAWQPPWFPVPFPSVFLWTYF